MNATAKPHLGQRAARQRWLVLGLGATLLAAYFAPPADNGGVVLSERAAQAGTRPAPPPSATTSASISASASPSVPSAVWPSPPPAGLQATSLTTSSVPAATVLAVQPRGAFEGDDGLFKGRAVAQAAVPAQPLPAAAAVASGPAEEPVPRLNLRLIGRYVDNGATAAFVQWQDQNLVVRQGEVLAAHYRVEQIDEVSLTVRHLPSEQLQTFRLDGPQ